MTLCSIALARCRLCITPGCLILLSKLSTLIDALFYNQVINADTVEILLDKLHDGRLIWRKVSPFIKHLRRPQRPVTFPVITARACGYSVFTGYEPAALQVKLRVHFFSKKNPLSMPRATERVYKKHTEHMGQNICPSGPKILPE